MGVSLNEMHQLEKDFLLYGEFDVNSTRSIIELFDSLDVNKKQQLFLIF